MRFRLWPVPFFCLAVALTSTAAEDNLPLGNKRATIVQEAMDKVTNELDRVQEDITEELSGAEQKQLYQQADQLLSTILLMRGQVTSQLTRNQLHEKFEGMDSRIHDFLEALKAIDNRSLNRAATRLWHADLELHFQIHHDSPEHKMKVLEQQMRAYALTARRLRDAASVLLTGPTAKSIQELTREAQQFDQLAARDATLEEIQNQFQKVNQAWAEVVNLVKLLPPRENVHLLRAGVQLDQVHERLFLLLEMEGKRPMFSFRL